MEYYLYLLQVMGAANPRTLRLLKKFGGAKGAYRAITKGDVGFLRHRERENLSLSSLERSREIIEYCHENGISLITAEDDSYPHLLKNIYNPPLVLFCKGSLKVLEDKLAVAVVGSRETSFSARRAENEICKALSAHGVVIVSGMAVGADKTAHTAALKSGGVTVGVLACGMNIDYPKGSMPFRDDVVRSGGAVITELLPGTRTDRGYFALRNRIMSGLSHGLLIVECAEVSGCHITANHATSQNRDIFCIPPSDLLNFRVTGVVRYLRDGAVPVYGVEDILDAYAAGYGGRLIDYEKSRKPGKVGKVGSTPRKKTAAKSSSSSAAKEPAAETPPKRNMAELGLSPEATVIVKRLKKGEAAEEELMTILGAALAGKKRKAAAETRDLLAGLLLDLEIDGIIDSLPGNMYKLL
ncbi:hypothetical protein FACS189499_10130 [Clostridia bacterium]|nr:hypothetical protein FACS189499_10130 [Clostridia bacterium]